MRGGFPAVCVCGQLPVQPDAPQVAPAGTGQVTGQVTEQLLTLLRACSSPQKSADLQKLVGMKHRETFQRNYLDPMLTNGWIARTIPDKPKSRMQRYVTTAVGNQLVDHPDARQ